MLAAPESLLLRVAFLIAIAVGAVLVSTWISRRTGWGPSGPLVLLAATPLVPAMAVGYGISSDDVLPAVGAILCLRAVDLRRLPANGWPRLLVAGAALMAVAGVVSSVANASGAGEAVAMTLKSAGHIAFLAVIGVAVVLTVPVERRRPFVARAIAAIATAEAAFGLLAWLVPLPGEAGLEASRQMTSLLGRVPGRIAGTIGLSPNFLGALFVLSLPLTVALAMRATDRREQGLWWLAAAAQLAALALTFTRTSLVIAVAILVVLLLARGHARALIALALLVGIVGVATPLGARMVGDANDRAALWTSAVRMMLDEPVTGVGPGRMLEVAASNPDRYRITEFGVATNNAHNTILLAGAETGLVGALGSLLVNVALAGLALGGLLAASRACFVRDRDPVSRDLTTAAALGILGFLVQGMTNNLFAVQVTSVTAMLVVSAFLVPAPMSLSNAIECIRAPLRRRSVTPA